MGEKNALRRAVLLALGLLLTAAVLFGCGRDENQEALKKISRERRRTVTADFMGTVSSLQLCGLRTERWRKG